MSKGAVETYNLGKRMKEVEKCRMPCFLDLLCSCCSGSRDKGLKAQLLVK